MIDDKTPLGWPLPHPSNDPFAVDVFRLRVALTQIDAAVSAARADLGERPTAATVDAKVKSAIDALKGAAPEAFDTLVEIAAKLASNDDAVAALLTQLATKAAQTSLDVTNGNVTTVSNAIAAIDARLNAQRRITVAALYLGGS